MRIGPRMTCGSVRPLGHEVEVPAAVQQLRRHGRTVGRRGARVVAGAGEHEAAVLVVEEGPPAADEIHAVAAIDVEGIARVVPAVGVPSCAPGGKAAASPPRYCDNAARTGSVRAAVQSAARPPRPDMTMSSNRLSIPRALAPAYAHCERIAREHYENFPVASRLLPAAMRPHVAAVYAFARAADDFADEGTLRAGRALPPARRLAGAASRAGAVDHERSGGSVRSRLRGGRPHATPVRARHPAVRRSAERVPPGRRDAALRGMAGGARLLPPIGQPGRAPRPRHRRPSRPRRRARVGRRCARRCSWPTSGRTSASTTGAAGSTCPAEIQRPAPGAGRRSGRAASGPRPGAESLSPRRRGGRGSCSTTAGPSPIWYADGCAMSSG